MVKLGLALPQYDYSLPGVESIDWPMVRDWAQRAEDLGFDSVWLSDHMFLDLSRYGGSGERQSCLECFTTVAALATVTSKVRLGTLVVCNDFRSPALVAKMAATLQLFSSGRFDLVMGAGWNEAEFEAAGIDFDSPRVRIERLGEAVEIIRGMAAYERFSFSGNHYKLDEVWSLPLAPDLKVGIGGKGDFVTKTAGAHADGFNTVWAWTPEAFGERMTLLNKRARRAGRDPGGLSRSVGLYVLQGRDEPEIAARWQRYLASCPPGVGGALELELWRSDKLAGTAAEIAKRIKAFESYGANEVILGFGLLPFQISDASAVEDFMAEVKPLLA